MWDPMTINYNRYRSDGRGVNSIQILAWMAAAANLTADPAVRALMATATAQLTNATNQVIGRNGSMGISLFFSCVGSLPDVEDNAAW